MANQLKVNQIANGAALVANTTYPFTADHHKVLSVQAVWTATTVSATVTLQLSNDGVTWDNFATATSISGNGNVSWYVDPKDTLYHRILITYTSGTITTFNSRYGLKIRHTFYSLSGGG
ncbi:hypothetical protein ACXYUI_26355, partial [Klebsiella pneumoniae]